MTKCIFLHQLSLPILALGDFNANNPLWSSTCDTSTNPGHSSKVLSLLSSLSLQCLNSFYNTNQPTHLYSLPSSPNQSTSGFSTIDLALTDSPHLFNSLYIPSHTLSPLLSDHLPIAVGIKNHTLPQSLPPDHLSQSLKWKFPKPSCPTKTTNAMWDSFADCCDWLLDDWTQSHPPDLLLSPSTDSLFITSAFSSLIDCINGAADIIFGVKDNSKSNRHPEWWYHDPQVKDAIKVLKDCTRAFHLFRSPATLLAKKQARTNLLQTQTEIRRQYFLSFINKLEDDQQQICWKVFHQSKPKDKVNSILYLIQLQEYCLLPLSNP